MSRLQAPAGHVTIVFTTIENSSRMTVALRKTYRKKFVPAHNARICAAVAAHNGSVVKTICDSSMLAFAQAADAVNCARAIQEEIAEPPITVQNARLQDCHSLSLPYNCPDLCST